MKQLNPCNPSSLSHVGAIMIALVIFGAAAGCSTASDVTAANTKPGKELAGSQLAASAGIGRPLTGPELYAVNCNRCHPERSPTERNPAEWATILTHMRVRANLPAAQAGVILKYLQENSGK